MSGGLAQTAQFLLATGTLMIGPSSKVMELTPALHSLGLVKNVAAVADPQFAELTQGVQNDVVYSVNTNNQVRISAEVYEHTNRNLAYGVGLDGSGTDFAMSSQATTLASQMTASAVANVATGDGADFEAGDWLIIQDVTDGNMDKIHVGKVASVASDAVTLATGYAVPTGVTFPAGSRVYHIPKPITLGAGNSMPALGAKIVGVLPEGNEPVTLVFPKVRITKGFSLSFAGDNFQNLPFEIVPYALLPTDPYYADFGGAKGRVFRR